MPPARTQKSNATKRLRLAATINTVKHLLHEQQILDRQMFLTAKPPYPVARTLLTNGILTTGIDSLFQSQQHVPTPHLTINYQPNPESTFWRT